MHEVVNDVHWEQAHQIPVEAVNSHLRSIRWPGNVDSRHEAHQPDEYIHDTGGYRKVSNPHLCHPFSWHADEHATSADDHAGCRAGYMPMFPTYSLLMLKHMQR